MAKRIKVLLLIIMILTSILFLIIIKRGYDGFYSSYYKTGNVEYAYKAQLMSTSFRIIFSIFPILIISKLIGDFWAKCKFKLLMLMILIGAILFLFINNTLNIFSDYRLFNRNVGSIERLEVLKKDYQEGNTEKMSNVTLSIERKRVDDSAAKSGIEHYLIVNGGEYVLPITNYKVAYGAIANSPKNEIVVYKNSKFLLSINGIDLITGGHDQ